MQCVMILNNSSTLFEKKKKDCSSKGSKNIEIQCLANRSSGSCVRCHVCTVTLTFQCCGKLFSVSFKLVCFMDL